MVEFDEKIRMNFLEETIDKSCIFYSLEVIESEGLACLLSFLIDPLKQKRCSVIIVLHLVYFTYKNYSH
jgi:hypothetical protein